MRKGYGPAWALAGLGLILLFQSCAKSRLQRSVERQVSSVPQFHMTGSTLVYEYEQGQVDFVSKNLSQVYESGVIDLLNSPDPMVRKLFDRIPLNARFYIILSNGQQASSSLIQINDAYSFVSEYSKKSHDFVSGLHNRPTIYSLSGAGGSTKLASLKIHLLKEALADQGIAHTKTWCVINNQPGPKGDYRNGALTLQIVDSSMAVFNEITHTAGKAARLYLELSFFVEGPNTQCR